MAIARDNARLNRVARRVRVLEADGFDHVLVAVVGARAVVLDLDLQAFAVFGDLDGERAAGFFFADAVLDRVFDERLEHEERDLGVPGPFGDLDDFLDLEPFLEAHLFEVQVGIDVAHLFAQRDFVIHALQGAAEKIGEVQHELSGFGSVFPVADGRNGIECVEQKVRADLGLQK